MVKKNNQIAFLLSFFPNPRIKRRISVAKALCDVSLICWNRGANMQLPPQDHEIDIHVIDEELHSSVLSRYCSNRRFGQEALKILKDIHPRIIHVQGLDMLGIAYKYRCRFDRQVKIIYEVADLHTLLVDPQSDMLHRVLQCYLRWQDRKLTKESDLLILTSDYYYKTYFSRFTQANKYIYLPNIPNLDCFCGLTKIEDDVFRIGYIGIIRYKEQLIHLIDTCTEMNVPLLVAGYEQGDNTIENKCVALPTVEWKGRFDFQKEAASIYARCAVVHAVYDADMSNVRVALPNKLYEAVYCELPIIVAKNTYLATIVEEWGVGIAVDHKNPSDLRNAIKKLMDPAQYSFFSENCRKHKNDINPQKYNKIYNEKLQELLVKE